LGDRANMQAETCQARNDVIRRTKHASMGLIFARLDSFDFEGGGPSLVFV
jgi:hypothetical protein